MKNLNANCLTSDLNLQKYPPAKKIKEPLREQDILFLQDIFLTKGFHHLKVDNIESGRSIVIKVLDSLNYYKNIGCLTTSMIPLIESVSDIYKIILMEKHLENINNLVEFFLDQFDFDFIWIEVSADLTLNKWYKFFEQHIIDFNFHKMIPIIFISY